ncbi:hypothetical protein G9A89_008514 [Geosiphon pyriformis]|nr:hypothetical protein G9A89_008514 [Geosiphon pyriformis]
MAGQKKVLVRDIPLGISDREVRAAMREFGEVNKIQIRVAGKWQSAVVEYNNQEEATRAIIEQRKTWEAKLVSLPQNSQSCFIPRTSKNYTRMGCAYIGFDSEASCNNATKKPLVIDDTLVHWVPTDAKECHFCYQKKEGDTKKVINNIRLAKLYVKRNVPEENIKAFDCPITETTPIQTILRNLKSEIDELRQQVNEMAKLLNAVATKLGVTIEKKEKEVVEIGLPSQSTTLKSTPAGKKKAYNPELEIKEIKKTLKPILELLKQVKKQSSWSSSTAGESKFMETDNVGLNNPSKAEEVLHWVIEEQFDFVIVTETKMTSTKKKGVFFGTDKYHAFWESSTEKQMGTGVGILVKKCWIHHVETIKGFHERLLHLGLKFRGKVSVHIVGLYMPAFKLPTERAVAKEIRKLLGDIVQNKEIIIVADNLNEDLSSKSLEETYATNKAKVCPTAATLQHMNLVDTHGAYATNNPEKTWASNGVQRRLDYVFTDAVTALLVTNIGVIDVNESFSTDYKAVALKNLDLGERDEAQRKSIDNNNNDLNQMWLTIKETVLQAAKCLPKRKVGAQSAHTKKECIDHKLVKIVDIIKQLRVNNADMHDNNILKPEAVNAYLMTLPKNKLIMELLNIKKEYRSTLRARIRLQQQR